MLILPLVLLLVGSLPGSMTADSTGNGLYPFTRRSNVQPVYGDIIELRVLDNADDLPGSFGWLTWNGSNSTLDLAASLESPGNAPETYYNPGTPDNGWTPDYDDHVIAIGKWVQGSPGNKNSRLVRDWLDWHIANQTPMVIPMYDAVAGQGSHTNYRVASFAAFKLQSYDLTGREPSMTGMFLRWVSNGPWVTTSDW